MRVSSEPRRVLHPVLHRLTVGHRRPVHPGRGDKVTTFSCWCIGLSHTQSHVWFYIRFQCLLHHSRAVKCIPFMFLGQTGADILPSKTQRSIKQERKMLDKATQYNGTGQQTVRNVNLFYLATNYGYTVMAGVWWHGLHGPAVNYPCVLTK